MTTARAVPEWIGATPDSAIPPRVSSRVAEANGWRCAICGQVPKAKLQSDHITALVNGGQNRESNLQPICSPCHLVKTGIDVQTKAKIARLKAQRVSTKATRQPMPGSRASGWRKRMSGVVERRNPNPR